MDIDELMQLLDIESPEEFTYFEQFADLVEWDGDIPFETLYLLFSGMGGDTLSELSRGYFEDLLESVPDDQTEFYALLSAIGGNLSSLAASVDSAPGLHAFTEEFFRFRLWCAAGSEVTCERASDGFTQKAPILQALVLHRMEKLGEDEYYYDFSQCMDYPLEEYVFTVGSFDEDALS
jgi:hypothetical protein